MRATRILPLALAVSLAPMSVRADVPTATEAADEWLVVTHKAGAGSLAPLGPLQAAAQHATSRRPWAQSQNGPTKSAGAHTWKGLLLLVALALVTGAMIAL